MGAQARTFIDVLAEAGFQYWQVCPLGPTGYGDSPYQCFSSYAGNPYLIDLEALKGYHLLDDLSPLQDLPHERVDFGALWTHHKPLLNQAYCAFTQNPQKIEEDYGSYADFKESQASWLLPYATFQALKQAFSQKPWWEWPQDYRFFTNTLKLTPEHKLDIERHCFFQYIFWSQWHELKRYAHAQGLSLIGDLPIFVAHDSVEAWSQPELFAIDLQTAQLKAQAGVPPDYFSPTGQLWGNPLYDWKAHKDQDYAWWMDRIAHQFEAFDALRIDHFRGFDTYWSVPPQAPTAAQGTWKKGPGLPFFKKLQADFAHKTFIAEDLGDLVPSVHTLLKETGLPGMQVLQFAFGSDAHNTHLPHNSQPNSVLYTSTHDNDTALGWYTSSPEATQDHLRRYLRIDGSTVSWDLIRCAYASSARLILIPLADLLSLGSEARLNTPGQAQGNWQWRLPPDALHTLRTHSSAYLLSLATLYGRRPLPSKASGGKGRVP